MRSLIAIFALSSALVLAGCGDENAFEFRSLAADPKGEPVKIAYDMKPGNEGDVVIPVGGSAFQLHEIAGKILAKIRDVASNYLGQPVSYGCSIGWVEWLNQYQIGKLPVGFWFAQQGSMYVFVVLIFVYAFAMDRLDRKYGVKQ